MNDKSDLTTYHSFTVPLFGADGSGLVWLVLDASPVPVILCIKIQTKFQPKCIKARSEVCLDMVQ